MGAVLAQNGVKRSSHQAGSKDKSLRRMNRAWWHTKPSQSEADSHMGEVYWWEISSSGKEDSPLKNLRILGEMTDYRAGAEQYTMSLEHHVPESK